MIAVDVERSGTRVPGPGRFDRCRVENQQGFVWRAGKLAGDHPPHLLQLLHEIALRVQPARGVDDDDVALSRDRRAHAVEDDRAGIAALLLADRSCPDALRPHAQLLVRRRRERCPRRPASRLPSAAVLARRELADRGRLADAIHADDHDDVRPARGSCATVDSRPARAASRRRGGRRTGTSALPPRTASRSRAVIATPTSAREQRRLEALHGRRVERPPAQDVGERAEDAGARLGEPGARRAIGRDSAAPGPRALVGAARWHHWSAPAPSRHECDDSDRQHQRDRGRDDPGRRGHRGSG